MASARLLRTSSQGQPDQQQQQGHHHHHHPPPSARHHHHHRVVATHPADPIAANSEGASQQHHHHRLHHHHHHHSHQSLQPSSSFSSPPSSPFPPRTDSPAFGMNKSSAPASPGTGTGSVNGGGQSQVISRTGRAAPAISTSFTGASASSARGGPDSAASASASASASALASASATGPRSGLNGHSATSSGAATTAGQIHQQSGSGGAPPPPSASSHYHHHHNHNSTHSSQQSSNNYPHHPSSSNPMNALPSGFGGPITVAEALTNVAAGPGSSAPSGHPASSSAPAPWSSSAPPPSNTNGPGPMSAIHPSSVIAGPSSHAPHGMGASSHLATMADGPRGGPIPSGHMGVGGVGGGVGGTTTESHHLSLRSVIEHGNILNNEAAIEMNYNVERRKKTLPKILQKLENETELCYSEIGTIAWNLNDYNKAYKNFQNALFRNPFCLISLQGLARYYHEKANGGISTSSTSTSNGGIGGSTTSLSGLGGISNGAGSITNGINGFNGIITGGAGVVANIEENYNKVVDYASRSLAIDDSGNEGEMWSLIGHAFLQLGQMPRAYSCYQQAIAKAVKKDDPKLWYGIGILYDRYGSVEHAEEAFASVLKLDPNFYKREEVFFRLGIIYKLQGKADASLECFHYILARPPEPLKAVDVWYQIGHAHELKRDFSLAKDAYERVLSTTPDHSKVLQHLGGIYLRENTPFHNPQKCIDYISQSLEHDSTDPFSWYLLGRAFMQQSNYGKAYEAYQQAVYRDGKNPAYWCSIGVLYFNINQYHDALDAYTRAVRIHPFIPEIWQNLGILYESCHDQLADATDAYQRASQLDPGNVELERRLKEVRTALRNGTEITTAPPPPQDIMPDSKSWQSVHMDVSGAKPVYLDSKSISQHPSPAPEAGLGLSSLIPGRPPLRGSPPSGPIHGIPPSSSGYGPNAGMQEIPNGGRRRSSFTRPDSSHAHYPPPHPAQYSEEALRSRHAPPPPGPGQPSQHLLSGQYGLTMASRPSVHSHNSTSSGQRDIDRDVSGQARSGPAGRMAASAASGRSSAYIPGERDSPHAMQDPTFRRAISPNSPGAEFEYQMRAADERERHMREREEQRAGSRGGPQHPQREQQQQQQQQQQQRRHPPPLGAATHSPTDDRLSAAYGHRDYQAAGPSSRRPGSPPPGPGGPRYVDDRPPPGRQLPGYPYDRQGGPPGYPDPRRDPRFNHDPRYDYAEVAAVERERMQAESQRQSRRAGAPSTLSEEEERRRMAMERNVGGANAMGRNGRRDLSPGDMLDGRERERDLRRPPPPNDGPGQLPSMRTSAPTRGGPGHYPTHLDQQRSSLDNGQSMSQKASADRRKTYGRHPDMAEGPQSHPSRQPEQSYDDETDMANALIGLAGGAPGAEGSSKHSSGPYRAGEKRPLSAHEDAPFKKARGQDEMGM